jgi:quinolinate synthase
VENFNDIQKQILRLKKEKDALILAHYYVPLEVQDIADIVGDSFEMAKRAKAAGENLIVVCGVRFMGESAKLLSPDKKVLIPAVDAGCPMADMVTPDDVRRLKAEHPNAAVMCYVNSSAAVKAECDICVYLVVGAAHRQILGRSRDYFCSGHPSGGIHGFDGPGNKVCLPHGFCPTHHRITEADILAAKRAHPDAQFAVHPECRTDVLRHADFVGSTSEIIQFARETEAKEVLIGTEMEIAARLQRELPDKKFYSVTSAFVCSNMKKVTLQAVLNCLEHEEYEIKLDKAKADAARQSLDKMVAC